MLTTLMKASYANKTQSVLERNILKRMIRLNHIDVSKTMFLIL